MSEKSKHIDLNSVGVSSGPESEAAGVNGKNDVVLGGSAVEEEEEGKMVRVLEEKTKESESKDSGVELEEVNVNVNEAKEERMENPSLKECDDKGRNAESSGCVNEPVLSGIEVGPDLESNELVGLARDEKGKDVSLATQEQKEGFSKGSGERVSVASDLGAKLDVLEPKSAMELTGDDPIKEDEMKVDRDKSLNQRDSEVSGDSETVPSDGLEKRDSGVHLDGLDKVVTEEKLDETGHLQSLDSLPCVSEVSEPKSEESAGTARVLVNDIPVREDEMRVDADESLKLRDFKVSSEPETVPSDGLQNEPLEGSDKGTSFTGRSESKLDETSHLQSLDCLPYVSEVSEPKPVESTEDEMKVNPDPDESLKLRDSKVSSEPETVPSDGLQNKPLEGSDKGTSVTGHSESKLDETNNLQSLDSLQCVSEVSEPKPVESTEDATKVDPEPYKSLNLRESKVSSEPETVPSDGQKNGELEVHLEAEPKRSGNDSDLIDIVIDLNPRKRPGKGASRDKKAKSVAPKPGFNIGDLVWGKVRSHPWWPGQICDPSAASRKAKKYFKRDSYLIAYYGDNTFAWNEASLMKPFLDNFSHMVKQSNTEDFHYAIDCVLEEVSRRVEFGLACPCLSKEVYEQIKSQVIVNAGIEEELSRRDGGDSSLTVASFEPRKLVEYVKELAQDPKDRANDKLEFTVVQSELLAFCRWKGYSQLPEFNMLGEILEIDAEILLSSENKHSDEATPVTDEESKDSGRGSEKAKAKIQKCTSSLKRKLDSKDSSNPSKKEKNLSDLMVEKRPKTPVRRNASESKATATKRKAKDAISIDSPAKQTESIASETKDKAREAKPSFRVGESIRRVASQLNGSSPILKNGNKEPKSSELQTKAKEEQDTEESESEESESEESESDEEVETEDSADETESQLSPAAEEPAKENNASEATSDDEQSLEDMFGGKHGKKSTKSGKKSKKLGVTELPHQLGSTNEAYWSDRIGKSIPEDDNDDFPIQKTKSGSKRKISDEDLDTETEKPEHQPENDSGDDPSPTALILNFSDLNSVPSQTNLNKIFSQYGSLNESQTEIFKKSSRAKVVFRKRSDAEIAFSSAGKYSTFGPSLVSYRLKYLASSPIKASPKKKKVSKEEQEG